MSHHRRKVALLTLVGGMLAAAAAGAGEKDFVVYVPGMGGTAETASPYVQSLLRELEKRLGWSASSADGQYFEDPKKALTYIETKKPGYGMLPASMFLDFTCKKAAIEPLAGVVFLTNPGGVNKYHVVVKGDALKDLKALEGKRLASNHLQNVAFVSRVIFAGKVDAATYFKLQPAVSGLKPLRQVDSGEADAALVDEAQLARLKTMPSGKSLRVIYSSPGLPPAPVVAFPRTAQPAERAAMRKALLGLCGTSAELCKSLQIARFEAIDPAAYRAATKSYCKP